MTALNEPVFVEAAQALAKKNDCFKCHAIDKEKKGPSYKKIAAKYKGQDVVATLMQKVRAGGKGVFGPMPMPPNGADKIADGDLKDALAWILKQ